MRVNMVLLYVLPSIFVFGPELVKSVSLNSLVEQFSHASLKDHFDSLESVGGRYLRVKREKVSDSDLTFKSGSTSTSQGNVATDGTSSSRFAPPTPSMLPPPPMVGEDGGAHCLVRCLRPMINKAPTDAGNETLICPKYDAKRIEELCDGYLQARQCLDECPESPLKNLSMSGFKPLQFMCVERSQDFKKYMPCLTSICEEVQKQCEPACGSLDESVRRLARIQQQVRGPGSRSRGADLDVPEIMQTVSDNCQLVGCVGNCSAEPMIRKCGREAYDLQRDTIWTMLSSMAQAMSSIGLNSVWPPQCQALLNADKQRHGKTENNSSDKGRGPNSTDRFVEKQIDRKSNNTSSIQTGSSPNIQAGNNIDQHATTASPSLAPIKGAASIYSYAVILALLFTSTLYI